MVGRYLVPEPLHWTISCRILYRVLPRFNDIKRSRGLCRYFEVSVFCFFRYRILLALRTFRGIGAYVVISRYQNFSFIASIFRALSKTAQAL